MRYFFDTEFVEDGKSLDLISIGIVAEDGRELYRESSVFNPKTAPEWIKKNVVPHLSRQTDSLETIKADILDFVDDDDDPEFWAYFGSYDWVLFCRLFGGMLNLPKGWPEFPRDIQIIRMQLGGIPLPPVQGRAHNALDDARWTRDCYDLLRELASLGNCGHLLFK